jgi:hypothetical protein
MAPAVVLAGAIAVTELSLTNVYDVAAVLPNITLVTPVKPLPEIVTEVPPAVVPDVGEMPVTVGVDEVVYVNTPVPVTDPPGAVITTLADPAVPAGVIAVISVSLTTVTLLAAVPPIVTEVAPVKPLPVMVTEVSPAVVPDVGEMLVNTGAGAVKLYWSAEEVVDVPTDVVTVMSTVAAASAGLIAEIELSLTNVYDVACVSPKVTASTPVNPLPEIVTEVPPAVVPDVGEMPVTVGGGAAVVVATVGDVVTATVVAVVEAVTVMACVAGLVLLPPALLSVNETV